MESIFRILTVVIFVVWRWYWIVTEKKADREKPKTSKKVNYVEMYALYVLVTPIFLQLFGMKIFFIPLPLQWQVIGFVFVLIGIGISMAARITLGANWAHASAYQIKQRQTLVSHGIYRYVRHPIYTGLFLAITGASLVAQSYLFLIISPLMFLWSYRAGKREEKILEKHFGKQYMEYQKRTKMLVPFLF